MLGGFLISLEWVLEKRGDFMKYNGYLIDLDGTMYRGEERIDAAAEFVLQLKQSEIPYLFVTNNSTSTQESFAKRLNNMDIPAAPELIFTSAMASAKYIRRIQDGARCYMIGEEGLEQALIAEGCVLTTDEDCDFVVIGTDRQITYEKYAKACLAVRNGATFISTNADTAVPTERGLLPGNGALTSVITMSTEKEPTFIGKPEGIMFQEALSVLGTNQRETLMVGDNYETDIMGGKRAGIDTLMVFTGITPYEKMKNFKQQPTYHAHSLQEWLTLI